MIITEDINSKREDACLRIGDIITEELTRARIEGDNELFDELLDLYNALHKILVRFQKIKILKYVLD